MSIFKTFFNQYGSPMSRESFVIALKRHVAIRSGTRDEKLMYALYAQQIGELETVVYGVINGDLWPTHRILDDSKLKIDYIVREN